jgi:hypothetical protein
MSLWIAYRWSDGACGYVKCSNLDIGMVSADESKVREFVERNKGFKWQVDEIEDGEEWPL